MESTATSKPCSSSGASSLSTVTGGGGGGVVSKAVEQDSGIENCNSSENSHCLLGADLDREDDTTSAPITTTRCFDDNSVSINDDDNELEDRNLVIDDLTADYEIVEPNCDISNRSMSTPKRDDNCGRKALPSKEEKQRQNEEIIILESSSVSSETGSWESVFPHQEQVKGGKIHIPEPSSSAKYSNFEEKPIRTACFIDASSLLDDTEMGFAAEDGLRESNLNDNITNCDMEATAGRKQGQEDTNSSIVTETKKIDYEIKDQFSSGEYSPLQMSNVLSSSSSSHSGHGGATPRQSSIDKEAERKQGSLVFKNSIPQYSGVLIDNSVKEIRPPPEQTTIPTYSSFPLRPSASEFNCLIDIYAENKRNSDNVKFNYFRSQSENHAEVYQIPLTETPHNSLMSIDPSQLNSGLSAKHSESIESVDVEGSGTPKRHLKYMESAPILSGGLSAADFTPKQCESPPVRRKLETCPILSGGFVSVDDDTPVEPKKEKPQCTSVKSWVIDLNEIPASVDEKLAEVKPIKPLSNSVPAKKFSGFYVNLSDDSLTVEKEELESKEKLLPKDLGSAKKSTGFFVDLSSTEERALGHQQSTEEVSQTPPISQSQPDKKNMFSMFIDFGEKKIVPKKDSVVYTSKLSTSISKRKELERRSESPSTGVEKEEGVNKCSSLSSIEGSSNQQVPVETHHVQLRPKLKSHVDMIERGPQKRHSWNISSGSSLDKGSDLERPTSFTSADKGVMSIIEKIPLLSKTSSMSIDSSISPMEDFTCSKSELSTFSNNSNSVTSNSNNSSTKELNRLKVEEKEKKRRKDVKINETFDKSSQSSITDGILSKDLSPVSTTTDDITYQNEPEAAPTVTSSVLPDVVENVEKNRAAEAKHNLEPIIEGNEKLSSPAKKSAKVNGEAEAGKMVLPKTNDVTHTMESLQATIEKQRKLLETVNEAAESTSFVRLSDMDKPFQSIEIFSTTSQSNLSNNSERRSQQRSTYDSHYYDRNRRNNNMYYSTDNNIINLASSVENSRSLSRIFPHLSKVFSSSLPANVGMENNISEIQSLSSDLSVNSSITSSCNRSAQDSGDESSIFCRQPRRLGEDLLKMFLHEIATDVTIDIGERKIRAHKCILRSRCQYFAAILAGSWVQSAGNVISLSGYSYESVHFALCHIYSGASHPPEGISLMELAALADLLGLVGLREVTAYALKVNYCHNFHKPCLGCIEGILQVLPVALNHGLDDLYRKCLKWTCKYYTKVWLSRAFACLSSDIRQRCQQQIIAHLCSENVLTTIIECENLMVVLGSSRWGANVENVIREILDSSQIYLSEHFSSLIASDSFLSLGHDQSCHIGRLETLLLRTASTLSPDQACRSYQRINKLDHVLHSKILSQQRILGNKSLQAKYADEDFEEDEAEEMDWDGEFISLIGAILLAVEQCLTRQCSRAMRTSAWLRVDLDLRKKIQKLACLTDPLFERRQKANSRNKPQCQPNSYNRNQDIHQVRLAIHAHSRRAAQGYVVDQYANTNHSNNKSHSTQTHHLNYEQPTKPNFPHYEKRDKSVQANHDLAKSNTRAHIPGNTTSTKTQMTVKKNETNGWKPSINPNSIGLQKAASTSHVPRSDKMKIEIKSRYLEIKKPQNGQPMNKNVKTIKQRDNMSSSETSTRTASPMTGRKINNPKLIVDSNMSLDSLSSPIKHGFQRSAILQVHHDDGNLSRDSLADSIRSSIRTEKTVSQESLVIIKPSNKPKPAKVNPQVNGIKKNSYKSSNESTSGSSSSVVPNNKSGGKLLRNFSDSGVTLRVKNNKKSDLSPNSTSSNASTRTSFLSKKSKEILERRAHSMLQQSHPQHNTNENKLKPANNNLESTRRSLPINKSSSTSNIPTNRRIFNTTLHLRKTAHMEMPQKTSKVQSKIPSFNSGTKIPQKTSSINQKSVKDSKNTKREKQEIEILKTEKAFEVLEINENDDPDLYESKLVRSSTFSKECADLTMGIEIN